MLFGQWVWHKYKYTPHHLVNHEINRYQNVITAWTTFSLRTKWKYFHRCELLYRIFFFSFLISVCRHSLTHTHGLSILFYFFSRFDVIILHDFILYSVLFKHRQLWNHSLANYFMHFFVVVVRLHRGSLLRKLSSTEEKKKKKWKIYLCWILDKHFQIIWEFQMSLGLVQKHLSILWNWGLFVGSILCV